MTGQRVSTQNAPEIDRWPGSVRTRWMTVRPLSVKAVIYKSRIFILYDFVLALRDLWGSRDDVFMCFDVFDF